MNRKRWPVLLAVAALVISAASHSSSAGDLYNKTSTPTKETPLPRPSDIKALSVFPTEVKLNGADDAQQLLLTAALTDGRLQDLTHDAKFEVADAKVARVTSTGRVVPLTNGATKVTLRFADKSVEVAVKTESCDVNLPINFGNQ